MEDKSIGQLFIVDKIQVFPHKEDECLVYNPRNNTKTVLTYLDVENALACKLFLELEEHVDSIYEELSEYQQNKEAIRTSLEKLIKLDLMVTPQVIIDKFKDDSHTDVNFQSWKEGWTLAICSADRPKLVERLLSTLPQHLCDFTVKPLILMIDDSRDAISSKKNKENIQLFCERNNLDYEFWNRGKRLGFCQKTINELPKCEESINYLLSPNTHPDTENTIGQARNFAVLKSAGKPLLMLDDDSLINPLQNTGYQSTLSLGYSGRRAVVKSSYDELFISFEKSHVNPLLAHLNVLGSSVSSRVLDSKTEIKNLKFWKGRTQEAVSGIANDNFIGLSVNAIVGALNSRQMGWFYYLSGEDEKGAAELLESLDYDENLSIDQATWNGRPFDEISRNIPFVGTTICGVSALPIVPPMPPIGRNEDLSLGATIRFLYKKSQVFQFGWGLPHLPYPARQWQPFQEQQEPAFNSTSYYITLLLQLENSCPFSEPEDRLNYLSEYLAKLSDDQTTSLLKDCLYGGLTHTTREINESINHTSAYPKYQQGCVKMLNYYQNEIKNINETLPKIQRDMKAFSTSYSLALADWHTIWSYFKSQVIGV